MRLARAAQFEQRPPELDVALPGLHQFSEVPPVLRQLNGLLVMVDRLLDFLFFDLHVIFLGLPVLGLRGQHMPKDVALDYPDEIVDFAHGDDSRQGVFRDVGQVFADAPQRERAGDGHDHHQHEHCGEAEDDAFSNGPILHIVRLCLGFGRLDVEVAALGSRLAASGMA